MYRWLTDNEICLVLRKVGKYKQLKHDELLLIFTGNNIGNQRQRSYWVLFTNWSLPTCLESNPCPSFRVSLLPATMLFHTLVSIHVLMLIFQSINTLPVPVHKAENIISQEMLIGAPQKYWTDACSMFSSKICFK